LGCFFIQYMIAPPGDTVTPTKPN